jgi:hypothetical protein
VGYHCDECGFTYDEADSGAAAAACRRLAREVATALGRGDADRLRPAPDVWSPLEYACHVRDVLLVQRERVLWAQWADDPAPAPMARDERVALDGYAQQEAGAVARQLADAADLFANVLDRIEGDGWDRGLVYGYPPPPKRRSLRWVAVHTVHELTHHLADIRRQQA